MKNITRFLLIPALLLWPLLGCSSLAPEVGAPVPVPAHWQARDAAGGAAATPTDLAAWWQRFDDAALGGWALRAQQGSPRAAAARRESRRASVRSSGGCQRWPRVGPGGGGRTGDA